MDLRKLAFIDVETTGGSAQYERIIDIAIIRVENGKEVRRFQSLIDPDKSIPQMIQRMTGITQAMTDKAPSFYDVAEEVQEMLEGCVFVAHNVRFDYSFVKEEFRRIGYPFSAKQLCTVKLSRKMFPAQHRHNLDTLMEVHGIKCENRHRAMDDTQAIFEFYNLCVDRFGVEMVEEEALRIGTMPSVPIYLNAKKIQNIPNTVGIYLFFGDNNAPLYVGKSVKLKNRVQSHFSSDIHSSKEMKISQQVKSIEIIETASELEALLLESQKIKELHPIYNVRLREYKQFYLLKYAEDSSGYLRTSIEYAKLSSADDIQDIAAVFRSKRQGAEMLAKISKEHKLCPRLLGIEKGIGACFRHQLRLCSGACCGAEPAEEYNRRVRKVFSRYKISDWPFEGEKLVQVGAGRQLVVDNWCVLGFIEKGKRIIDKVYEFDLDSYKILRAALCN
jgi:DNA polymerase-3 subunit epsilon